MNEILQRALLHRVNIKIPAGETIKYLHYGARGGFAIVDIIMMLVMIPLVSIMLPFVFISLFLSMGSFDLMENMIQNLSWVIILTLSSSVIAAVLLRNKLYEYYSFIVIAFTETAIYMAVRSKRKNVAGSNMLTRFPYTDITGIDYSMKAMGSLVNKGRPCVIRIMVKTQEPLSLPRIFRTMFKYELAFTDLEELSWAKNLIESLVFGYQPLATQQVLQYKKMNRPVPVDPASKFKISAKDMEAIKAKQRKITIATPVGVWIGTAIMLGFVVWSLSLPSYLIGLIMGYALGVGLLIIVMAIVVNVKEHRRLGAILLASQQLAWVDSKGITITAPWKQETVPFTPGLCWRIACATKSAGIIETYEINVLELYNTDDKSFKKVIGPLEDTFGLLHDFLNHYIAWMQSSGNWFTPDEVNQAMLEADPFKQRLVDILEGRVSSPEERPLPPRKKVTTGSGIVMEASAPASATARHDIDLMAADTTPTRYPAAMYQLYLEPGERIIHVYKPGHLKNVVFSPGFIAFIASCVAILVILVAMHISPTSFIPPFIADIFAVMFLLMCGCCQGLIKITTISMLKKTEIAFTQKKMICAWGDGKVSIVPRDNFSHVEYGSKVLKGLVYKTVTIYFKTPLVESPFISKFQYFLYWVDVDSPAIAILDEFSRMRVDE
nr:hypothetical protein [Candidatus Sigynarchaeota archaeon]